MLKKLFKKPIKIEKSEESTVKGNKENNGNCSDEISKCIIDNRRFLQDKFYNSVDVKFYDFVTACDLKVLVVYIEEIIKKEVLDRDVIGPLILKDYNSANNKIENNIFKEMLPISNVAEINNMTKAIENIVEGNAVFFIEGSGIALSISSRGWEKRSVEEPLSEAVIRGPKEGFIESISVNRSMIRRKIKSASLVFEEMKIGKQTKTSVNIIYIAGIVNEQVLKEVKKRLSNIDIDAVLDAGYIEGFIEDSHISPISTVGNTQKPDIVAGKILEGRVAIMCDGSPHVLTVPHLFAEAMQSSEDYYVRPYIASVLRLVRLVAFVVSILLPSFYVALETYHQEMIPTVLLVTMTGANEGTPLPAFVEALLMIIALEFLKESGTRLPRAIGSAISIVGALVLGDAAVKAGIISADLIVVIAFTAVSTFIVPALNEVTTLYRLFFLILAGVMGLYGITAGIFLMVIHATALRSFGVPYLSPLAPLDIDGMKDFAVRYPLAHMITRPRLISKRNKRRIGKRSE